MMLQHIQIISWDTSFRNLNPWGFVSNQGKLFHGKFRNEDTVKGISVVWESSYEKVRRSAQEEYNRDYDDPEVDKPLWPFEYYLSYNDPGTYGYGVPASVEHLDSLEVRTSPDVLNNTLQSAMEGIEKYVAEQQKKELQATT